MRKHRRHRRAGHQKRADDVGFDDQPPRLGGRLPEARRLRQKIFAHVPHAAPGIVDQDVQAPKTLERRCNSRRAIVLAGHVGKHGMDGITPAAGVRVTRETLDLIALARGCGNDRAPAWARPSAIARPRPLPPPVTMATRPVSGLFLSAPSFAAIGQRLLPAL